MPEVRIPLRSDESQLLVGNLNDVGDQPGEGHHRVAGNSLVVIIDFFRLKSIRVTVIGCPLVLPKAQRTMSFLWASNFVGGLTMPPSFPIATPMTFGCGEPSEFNFSFCHAISNAQPPVRAQAHLHPVNRGHGCAGCSDERQRISEQHSALKPSCPAGGGGGGERGSPEKSGKGGGGE